MSQLSTGFDFCWGARGRVARRRTGHRNHLETVNGRGKDV